VTSVSYGPADDQLDGQGYANVSILEGTTIRPTPAVGESPSMGQPMRSILPGPSETLRFDETYLSKHVLFIGGMGTGKTNAMMHLLRDQGAGPADEKRSRAAAEAAQQPAEAAARADDESHQLAVAEDAERFGRPAQESEPVDETWLEDDADVDDPDID
jgi:hypothetical protein